MRILTKHQNNFAFFLVFIMFLFQGCFSAPKGSSRSAKRNYEVFYAGDKGNMYFIKPLQYISGNNTILADYTFTHRDDTQSEVTIAFSIISPIIFKKLDEMKLVSPEFSASTNEFSLMFNETHKKGFVSRFNANLSLSDLEKSFQNPAFKIEVTADGNTMEFLPTAKTMKVHRSLNSHLFVFIRD
jgi:hypothetical protein